jgi:hypothetical protein
MNIFGGVARIDGARKFRNLLKGFRGEGKAAKG